jgi:hypothetical protein
VLTLLEKLILPWSTTIASYANWQPRTGSVTHGSCTGVGGDEVDHKTKVVARLGGGAGFKVAHPCGNDFRLTVLAPLERDHREALNPRMCGGLLILLDVDGKTEQGIM